MSRNRNEASALKPIGAAMAAVVAGLGAAQAQSAEAAAGATDPTPRERAHYVDPTALEDAFIPGPSEPAEVLGEPPATETAQADLFDGDDVPLGRA